VETLNRLLGSLRECCAGLPDRRTGKNGRYSMAEIGLAAFSVFFMQSPSFLAHQRHLAQGQGRSNCENLFGMTAIPCDNHIRAMLDAVPPARFDPVFAAVVGELERAGGMAAFRRLGGHVLIALDGTEYFRSAKLHCAQCSQRARAGGRASEARRDKTEYFHSAVMPALVAPGHSRVVPLEPEFIRPQDGHDKQDCNAILHRAAAGGGGRDDRCGDSARQLCGHVRPAQARRQSKTDGCADERRRARIDGDVQEVAIRYALFMRAYSST
jgi:hypothetical protein